MAEESKIAPVRWDLVHDAEGWSLQPAISWLIAAGRGLKDMKEVAEGSAKALRAGDAPVSRLRVTTLTLHPQVNAWGGEWDEAKGADQVDFPFSAIPSPAFVGSPIDIMRRTGKPFRRRLEGALGPEDHKLLHELKEEGLTDYYATGMMGETGATGFVTYATQRPGGFTDLDIAKFDTFALFVSPTVDTVNRRRIAATLLDTYIGHRAGGRVLDGHIKRGDREQIRAAFWYSDLRDFTGLNEDLAPDQMIDMLNTYFGVVADAIMPRGGEVLQFIGDAVLAIFECAMDEADTRRACEAAFDAAHEALLKTEAVNGARRELMLPEIRFGIGLHVGDVTFGNVGSDARLGFNVVGPAVNLTARLQTLSKQALVPLLVSSNFAASIERELFPVGSFELRGVREMQEVFTAAKLVDAAAP
jgi:adenylate cyclase